MEQDSRPSDSLKIVLDKDLNIVSITDQWCDIIKCLPAKALDQSINSFLSEKHSLDQLNINSKMNKDLEVEMISCDGHSLFMVLLLSETENNYIIYGQDVTSLRKAQIQLDLIEHHAKIGFWEYNPGGRSFWSDEIFNIFEVPNQPVTQEFYESIRECYRGDGRQHVLTHWLTRENYM